jgi:quinol monooxygenase YgiN
MKHTENDIKITVHVKIIAKPGKVEQLIDAYEKIYQEARKEPGCEYCELLQNIDNPELMTVVEKFSNYRAFKAHMQMPVLRHFIDDLSQILTEKIDVSFHVTRIDCIGTRSIPGVNEPTIEELSFRDDLMDRADKQ